MENVVARIGESCWKSLLPTLCVDALGGHLARRWGALLRHLRLRRLGHQARLFVHLEGREYRVSPSRTQARRLLVMTLRTDSGNRAAISKARSARQRPGPSKPGSPHGSGLGVVRWVVERTLAWLHPFRRLALRYERRADATKLFSRSAAPSSPAAT